MSPCGSEGEGDGDDRIIVHAKAREPEIRGAYVPVPFAVSCLTALLSAMFSCSVGAKTAMDMAQNTGRGRPGKVQVQVAGAGGNEKE